MSDAKLVSITSLMKTYNFEIEELPDYLQCAQCKLVLKIGCQVPCGCRFCRTCIDDMMARGSVFCPGDSEDCGESLLARFTTDYVANKRVSRLTVKCPHDGCVHVCQLANMEEHLQECSRKSEECPFRELGCTQDKLTAEQMGGHLQQDTRRHSEILIEMVANINREIETLKARDEASSREIEKLKHELVLKDKQIRSIMNQMIHVQKENESIKNDMKSIKEENADLAGQVGILSEKIEREIAERYENDELDSARVIDHVDREIAAVTGLIGSNKDKIGLINIYAQSIKDDISSMKSEMQSLQDIARIDAVCEWLIDDDIDETTWNWEDRQSEYFTGAVYPYKYRLKSVNFAVTGDDVLYISVFIHPGPCDGHLSWPFEGKVTIIVADKDRHDVYASVTLQCKIERPPDDGFRFSGVFQFRHSKLREAGLNLGRGGRVSCVIAPDSSQ